MYTGWHFHPDIIWASNHSKNLCITRRKWRFSLVFLLLSSLDHSNARFLGLKMIILRPHYETIAKCQIVFPTVPHCSSRISIRPLDRNRRVLYCRLIIASYVSFIHNGNRASRCLTNIRNRPPIETTNIRDISSSTVTTMTSNN